MASPQLEFVPAQSAPTGALTTLYTSPASVVTRIDRVTVSNNGAAAATITIALVPAGQSASGSNTTTPAKSIAPGDVWNSPNEYGHYLNAGDSFAAMASAGASLTIAAGGTQIS